MKEAIGLPVTRAQIDVLKEMVDSLELTPPPLEQKGATSLCVTNNKLQEGYIVKLIELLEIVSSYNNLAILSLNF